MADKIYVGDTPKIELDTGEDLTTSTVQNMEYQKPDGSTGVWSASIDSTKLWYQTLDGDLDQAGAWFLQLYIELPQWKGRSETVHMIVNERWE